MSTGGWITLGVIAAVVLYVITIYNGLIGLRNRFRNAFSQIDVQLQRRYELIPNLVESARAYLKHERETLEAVVRARDQAAAAAGAVSADPTDAARMQRLNQAEAGLAGAMGQFRMLVENYPDLKANQTIQQLMEDLRSTDNRVAYARQSFNDSVMEYNIYREQFPNNLVGGFFVFRPAEFLDLDEPAARQPVRVSFDG